MNTIEHFKGNHANCPKGHSKRRARPQMKNPKAVEQLRFFHEKTVKLAVRTRHDFDSQMCESFNAIKAHFADKLYRWKVSWQYRVMCAVLRVNDPVNWREGLAIKCRFRNFNRARFPSHLRYLAGVHP
jgi:hypothetical protein